MNRAIKKYASLVLATAFTASTAMAFPVNHFASSSRLAQGTWVKIAVSSTGVYELTDEELLQMGFSNPANVQVYGMGGNVISETLNGVYPDDLQPVSMARFNGKLCFYALGPTTMTMVDSRTETPRYTRVNNTYSTKGYYFLAETADPQMVYEQEASSRGSIERTTGLGYFLHESDRISIGLSGKSFLGEDLGKNGFDIPFYLPGNASPTITVNTSVALNCSASYSYVRSTVTAGGTSASVTFPDNQARIYAPVDASTYYNTASPVGKATLDTVYNEGSINANVFYQLAEAKLAKLDYCIISYNKHNNLEGCSDSQSIMGIPALTSRDCIMLPHVAPGTVVWNVDDAQDPVQYELTATVGEDGEMAGYEFTPRVSAKEANYVIFDPSNTLKKIDSYEAVTNQNIHALPTPDMVIVTNKTFMEQAERVAQLHRNIDGMTVHVIDQEQIFNEFSSGTPDAMAIRLMCKMFYDRDKTKFRNLLLFGQGSYDNRGLVSNKPNRILTYQSEASNSEVNTYTSDDFYAFLDDDSGITSTLYSDIVRIGVGRYPVASVEEARKDVDKLIKYVTTPDYGPWRNDVLFMADSDEKDPASKKNAHIFQSEGVCNIVEGTQATQLQSNKVYVEMFQRESDSKQTSLQGRRKLLELFQNGQYFATYTGHADSRGFSLSNLWPSTTAQSTSYPHLPIMTTACCEVARYDSDTRGVAEHMFHHPNGGAIAMITTPRQTYDEQNYLMNKNFVKSLFSYNTKGMMPTLGEAYIGMKTLFGTATNGNKLSYSLLGDPAIKCNYPKPLFNITTINSTDITEGNTVNTAPMQQLTVTAQVMREDGQGVDTGFNGDATLSLYGSKRLLKTVHGLEGVVDVERDIFFSRDLLARIQGRVVDGNFTGTIIVPRHEKTLNEQALVRVYAHQDNSSNMVNGESNAVMLTEYNENTALTDDNSPVIESMFINDEQQFSNNSLVAPGATLYIRATDDLGINTMEASMGNAMKLSLDGGKTTYPLVKNCATASEGGTVLNVAFPLNDISEGTHSLSFTVFDVAGNSTTRSISFIVGNTSEKTIEVAELPATTQATINMQGDDNMGTTIKVTDPQGNLVFTTQAASFPFTWDLKGMDGNRVKPGLYKVFAMYNDGTTYGSTNVADLIVIDPLSNTTK